MNTEMVAPSQLHRDLERAGEMSDERQVKLASTLRSRNLAVIRRIPQLLSPLSDEEKEMVAQWAEDLTQNEDISNRDFAFHLMANCDVSGDRILGILEQNRTFSRSALEHIQKALGGSEAISQLDKYLLEVAEKLLTEGRIPSRDRGRHMLMTLARDEDNWQQLTRRFSETEISDLRQRVLERFLEECPDGAALTLFVENVVKMCLSCIRAAAKEEVHQEASHMHWVLACLKRLENKLGLSQAASLLERKFGATLPRSVRYKLQSLLPPVELIRTVQTVRGEPQQLMALSLSLTNRTGEVKKQEVCQPTSPRETNKQVAAKLGISKRQVAKKRARGELS